MTHVAQGVFSGLPNNFFEIKEFRVDLFEKIIPSGIQNISSGRMDEKNCEHDGNKRGFCLLALKQDLDGPFLFPFDIQDATSGFHFSIEL